VTIVALVGDATTTTAVALAVGWPAANDTDEVIVVEADRAGGSLAAWLDTPTQPTLGSLVASVGSSGDPSEVLSNVDAMAHHSSAGVRFVANAVQARAAHRAVEEAAGVVLPALAASATAMIADTGRHRGGDALSPAARSADVVVVVHRQAPASAGAASVRIERLVETVEDAARLDAVIVLAVIGAAPFEPSEVAAFVASAVPDTISAGVTLADDTLAALTIAGRTGVSARRLRRLPLMRDAVDAAAVIDGLLRHVPSHVDGPAGNTTFS